MGGWGGGRGGDFLGRGEIGKERKNISGVYPKYQDRGGLKHQV